MFTLSFRVLLFCVCFVSLLKAATEKSGATYGLKNDISYVSGEPRCVLDVYYPEGGKSFATVVWFHGGGLTGGEKFIPEGLKKSGIAVVAVEYRLMPQVGIETCLKDAAEAVAWTVRNIAQYGGDPRQIYVGGHSAGAYLTTMLVLDSRWMNATGLKDFRAAGLLAISGQMVTHFELRKQRGIPATQVQVDEFAPFFHVKAGLPPILLVTGGRELELLGRYEENAYFARMLRLAGNQDVVLLELQGFDHGGVGNASAPLMLKALRAWSDKGASAGVVK